MNRFIIFLITCLLIVTSAFSQVDTLNSERPLQIFDRLAKSLKEYRLDTTAVPKDKITKVIMELRDLRGGFNINEAIEYKLEEDKQKNEFSEADFANFSLFFRNGNGKKWLDNAVTWIYRQHFTYPELKQLVKFYKTAAGQKMSTEFPVIMMKSLTAAERIKDIYMEAQRNKK